VFLVQIAKELGPRDKLSHQGEEAHETEGRAHEEQQHANYRHAGVEEGQVEAVHACQQKTHRLIGSSHEIYLVEWLAVLRIRIRCLFDPEIRDGEKNPDTDPG
jgi:hypothetical protein